jgi:hypothetical protein
VLLVVCVCVQIANKAQHRIGRAVSMLKKGDI